jgi:hypothetical protein
MTHEKAPKVLAAFLSPSIVALVISSDKNESNEKTYITY